MLPVMLVAAVLLLSGCATDKDRFLNRNFHKLTARDNGWFNAMEKLGETVDQIERNYIEDFDEVLPIFIYGTEQQATNASPELEICIEKCSVVIDRHSMDIGGKELNPWIPESWFIIGQSHFYKRSYYEAQRVFAYIARTFKGADKQMESKLWGARAAIELEQYSKAQTLLDEVRGAKELPKRFPHDELSAVQADLDLRREKLEDAIMHLEHAVGNARRKFDRVRWSFILAQLYQRKGLEEQAIRQYGLVVRMSPPYELGFHAQIFQVLAFSKGDSKAMRHKLHRMLRDEKHVDHFDMIHYALADLDLKERNKPGAIEHLETSALVSTTDTRQKAKTWLKLADLYFDDRKYAPAQKYYDSTSTLIQEEHARYEEVLTRAEVLGDLVEQLGIIAREDSLQELARMDPEQRDRKIRQMIREREREEEEKERLEREAREMDDFAPSTSARPGGGGGGGRGQWYFYDQAQMGRGQNDFRKRWGNRKLEDDWRRKDRSGSAKGDFDEDELAEGGGEKSERDGEPEWKNPEFYLRDLPLEPEAIAASDEMICTALYKSGMIYKEQLKDTDNAIESFENLHSRFDECRYTPESFYQLYRIYKEKEEVENFFSLDGSGSEMYANIIFERFPNSEFARLIRDPNVLEADAARRLEEEAAYQRLYGRFRIHAYLEVINESNRVIREEPQNHFRAKYYLLKAMAVGGMRSVEAFRTALEEVKEHVPGTDEAKAAEELLAALARAEGAQAEAETKKSAPPPAFRPEQGQHYFALVVPNAGNDMNEIKGKIADFNKAYFRNVSIQITNSFLDSKHQVVLLSVFESRKKAMEYYDTFLADTNKLQGINDQQWASFAISPDNYSQLYKSKDVDGYTAFFTKNYLERQ